MKNIECLVRRISLSIAAGALIVSTVFSLESKVETQNSLPLEIPKYNIPDNRCAAYARRAAGDLFKKKYSPADAWNMRYVNKIISPINNLTNLNDLEEKQMLNPGSIIGLTNPKSKYKDKIDSMGNKAKYTHVALYLGKQEGKHYVAHQFGDVTEKTTLETLAEKGLTPIEVLNTEN